MVVIKIVMLKMDIIVLLFIVDLLQDFLLVSGKLLLLLPIFILRDISAVGNSKCISP